MMLAYEYDQLAVFTVLVLIVSPPWAHCLELTCWPPSDGVERPEPYTHCPGITASWLTWSRNAPQSPSSSEVTIYLHLSPAFYQWALAEGILVHSLEPKFRDATEPHRSCERSHCPDTPNTAIEASASHCCFHYVNIHYCKQSPAWECEPWQLASENGGSIRAATEAQAGSWYKEYWAFTVPAVVDMTGDVLFFAVLKTTNLTIVFQRSTRVPRRVVAAILQSGGNRSTEGGALSYEDCINGTCGGNLTESKMMDCSNCTGNDCVECDDLAYRHTNTVLASLLTAVLVVVVAIICCYSHWRHKNRFLKDESWIIPVIDIVSSQVFQDVPNSQAEVPQLCSKSSVFSIHGLHRRHTLTFYCPVATVREQLSAVKKYHNVQFQLTLKIRKEVRTVRSLHHPNLCRFVGATVEPGSVYIMFEYCARGSVQDVLQNESVPLSWLFRFSMLSDIAHAMAYLHNHGIVHGNLKSSNCVVDDRWTCKVTDYGLKEYRHEEFTTEDEADLKEMYIEKQRLSRMYKAPETADSPPIPASDVYAFAIIMVEMATRKTVSERDSKPRKPSLPSFISGDKNTPTYQSFSVLTHHRQTNPKIRKSEVPFYVKYQELIAKCWADKPSYRPDFVEVGNAIAAMWPSKKHPVDTMMELMQMYSKNLETLVEERSHQLLEEKRRTDELLYSILPRRVAERLKHGEYVMAEWFDCCTVFFSDIVGFTALSARSTPMQVVELLNKLYTTFDSIIEKHNVYKVETIGDAYMVVSGVPERTDQHALYVANMALEIIKTTRNFTIPHLVDEQLHVKAGLHSGPVCAGVVGVKMPRYCLFGDTVNTASRMESTSNGFRVHISNTTYEQLMKYDKFRFESRGRIFVKGKGEMHTFWLRGLKGDVEDEDTFSTLYVAGEDSGTYTFLSTAY